MLIANFEKKQAGFTIVEILVVLLIVGLIVPSIFSIAFTISRQQQKLQSLQKIKEEGDFARNQIIHTIRDKALEIVDCSQIRSPYYPDNWPNDRICFKDASSYFGYFISDEEKIASFSIPQANVALNTPKYYYLTGENSQVLTIVSKLGTEAFFQSVNSSAVKFSYSLIFQPTISRDNQQKLDYIYYVYLRTKR